MKDPQLLFDHIDWHGETSARRLFAGRLVDQVQQVAGLGHLNLGYIPWGAGMSGGETSGVDLARVTLRAAMAQARQNGGGQRAKSKPRPVRTGAGTSASR
ncbi:hypothetical protein [Streptomyces puniciscabiei]|uniref:hypothetical protein n=1 Tax=Streptomyces puniciscabiei TaxID=164348 RepID=UPI00331C8B06